MVALGLRRSASRRLRLPMAWFARFRASVSNCWACRAVVGAPAFSHCVAHGVDSDRGSLGTASVGAHPVEDSEKVHAEAYQRPVLHVEFATGNPGPQLHFLRQRLREKLGLGGRELSLVEDSGVLQ